MILDTFNFPTIPILLMVMVMSQVFPSGCIPSTSTTATPVPTSGYNNPLVAHKHERNCKALCEHCGCIGFYCGEECICECNNENSDTECIHTMQVNARTLNTPFEILIQGPSCNRFVRNAQQFEQKRELVPRSAINPKTFRNRRSTITIYKPLSGGLPPALSLNTLESASIKIKKSEIARHKRSVDHLEWFNDFTSSLVRPSPLGTRNNNQRASKPVLLKRATSSTVALPNREPWFLDQAVPKLTRPAPLYKRQPLKDESQHFRKTKKPSITESKAVSIEEVAETELPKSKPEIRPLRDALQVVERIPRVLQDTVSHLAADNNSGDVFSLNIMNDVRPRKIQQRETKFGSRRQRGNKKVNDFDQKSVATNVPPFVLPPVAFGPRTPLFPWLRQQRLRRLRAGQIA